MAAYLKAIAAGVIAFCGAGATAAADDRITTGEWWAVASATAAAAFGVWLVPNHPKNEPPA